MVDVTHNAVGDDLYIIIPWLGGWGVLGPSFGIDCETDRETVAMTSSDRRAVTPIPVKQWVTFLL